MHYYENERKREWGILGIFLLLIGYGVYKNGLTYYFLGKLNLLEALKLLLFPLLGVGIALLIKSLKEKKVCLSRKNVILGLFYGMVMPSQFPILLFCLFATLFSILYEFFQPKFPMLSWLTFYKIIEMVLAFCLNIGLENQIEASTPYLYGMVDTFFGRGIGAFGTTNIFLLFILSGILCTSFYYKKELPLYSMISYCVFFFLSFFLFQSPVELKEVLNSTFFFVSIVLLPQSETSPCELMQTRIYGIGVGIVSFLFIHLFHLEEGAYLSLFLANILWNLYFLFWKKKIG